VVNREFSAPTKPCIVVVDHGPYPCFVNGALSSCVSPTSETPNPTVRTR
jgi:hypothetical protein